MSSGHSLVYCVTSPVGFDNNVSVTDNQNYGKRFFTHIAPTTVGSHENKRICLPPRSQDHSFPPTHAYGRAMNIFSVTFGDWLFSLKTYAAALIALYIAFSLNISQPYWALLTVLIVAQPYTGMVRSKAVYRFVGTFVGASMAVLLVPNFVNLPELLTLVFSIWIALCLYLSLIDGTPRSYAYILAGYTVALIGFPSVEHPENIFNTAVSRVEEVCLGILSTFIVNELFFPRSSVDLYFSKIGRWLQLFEQSMEKILSDPPGSRELGKIRHRLSIDLTALVPMAIFASYDTSSQSRITGMNLLRFKLSKLLPALSEIVRHLERMALQDNNGMKILMPTMEKLKNWMKNGSSGDPPILPYPLTEPGIDLSSPSALIRISLTNRLVAFLILWKECHDTKEALAAESSPFPDRETHSRQFPHRDHLLAGMSALAIFLTVLIVANIWIFSQWPDGAIATMMAAVVSSFFAAMDDPAPAIFRFLGFLTIGSAVGIFFLFSFLPLAHDFLELSLLLAIVLIPAGIFLGRPDTNIPVLAFSIGFGGLVALSATYSGHFSRTLNIAIAQFVGVMLAASMTQLIRSVGADWSVRRLFHADLLDLAKILRNNTSSSSLPEQIVAHPNRPELPKNTLDRILDRTSHLALRLQALSPSEQSLYSEGFLHIGVARTLIDLSALEERLSEKVKIDLSRFRISLSEYFEQVHLYGRKATTSQGILLERLRHSLQSNSSTPDNQEALLLLVALEVLLPIGFSSPSIHTLPTSGQGKTA